MRHLLLASRNLSRPLSRQAFTLVELLVVVLLVLILTAITVMSVNFSINADRMRSGARQMQSLLGGARDRAIYAKEVRGLRLLLDPNDNHTVNAVQYIGSPERDTQGTVTFDGTGNTITGIGTRWAVLSNRGLLKVGARIQIPRDTGAWYTVATIPSFSTIGLNRSCRDLAGVSGVSFALELAPAILSESNPTEFPAGVVIDLDGSQVPSSWRPPGIGASYPAQMDILFSPQGTVVGDCATLGMVHLHFADRGDVTKWKSASTTSTPQGIVGRNSDSYLFGALPLVPADDPALATPIVSRDRILVTLGTRTGRAAVHHVNVTNTATAPFGPPSTITIDRQKIADDPYLFAETGEVANK